MNNSEYITSADSHKHLRFPVGEYTAPETFTDLDVDKNIQILKDFPGKLRNLVGSWSDKQLDCQYRTGGWTVRQLVNHLADSHMMAFIRFKLALTDETPTVTPYNEARWAELQDSINMAIEPALSILQGLHLRWVHEIRSLTNREIESKFYHPGQNREISLREQISFYAWHCEHHFAHLRNLQTRKNW